MYVDRDYRSKIRDRDLRFFQVKLKETDLHIGVDASSFTEDLVQQTQETVWQLRNQLELYIQGDPVFRTTLLPHFLPSEAPEIAQTMGKAAWKAQVGPMAAVAGAMAEAVGRDLLQSTQEVLVENGGDIFLKVKRQRLVGVFAGKSPFSHRLALEIQPDWTPLGICTSSGTVGPSYSAGQADAAIVLAQSAALADAAASAVGNAVMTPADLEAALGVAQNIPGVLGAVVIKEDKLAVWGLVNLVPIK